MMTQTKSAFSHLDSSCNPTCAGVSCNQVARIAENGRWFITMFHAGFNSPANNRNGYATKAAALSASAKFGGR